MPRSDSSLAEGLFAALRDSDGTALHALLPAIQGRLQALAKQRLSEPLAEDAVQETLATLWRKRDALQSAHHVLPFIFQILRNKIGNTYLQAKRRSEVDADLRAGERELRDPATDPYLIVEGHEFENVIDRAIERCAAEHEMWGAILRMLREGLSPAEIRESLGDVPMATVHTRIFRARQRLKQILREDFDIDL